MKKPTATRRRTATTPPTAPPITAPDELELEEDDSAGMADPSEVLDGFGLDVAEEMTSMLVFVEVGGAEKMVATEYLSVPDQTLVLFRELPAVEDIA
jgi:hypothetical protein